MVNKELINRLVKFLGQVPLIRAEEFLEKFLRKLKSEVEIQNFKVLGYNPKTHSITSDIKQQNEWCRMNLFYNPSDTLSEINLTNHEDIEDYYSNKLQ